MGLREAQNYEVSNVYRWLNATMITSKVSIEAIEKLPRCIPPYPFTYAEWDDEDGDRQGALCAHENFPEGRTHRNAEAKSAILVIPFIRSRYLIPLGTAWLKLTKEGRISLERDDEGNPVGIQAIRSFPFTDLHDRLIDQGDFEGAKWADGAIARGVWTAAFTFSLLNCRNVRTIERDPREELSRQALRRMERKKEDPIFYKELEVRPLSPKMTVTEGSEESGVSHRRLHTVAGHFAEYGPEYGKGKLFGKLEGAYFIPDHVRGSLEEGVIAKTYKVRAPREQDVTPEALETLGTGG
jgi:hypothetical protein